jgi:hypothetical protein
MAVFRHERKVTPPKGKPGWTHKIDAGIKTLYYVTELGRRLYWCAAGQIEMNKEIVGGNGYIVTLYTPFEQHYVIYMRDAEELLMRLWTEKNTQDTWSYVIMDEYE